MFERHGFIEEAVLVAIPVTAVWNIGWNVARPSGACALALLSIAVYANYPRHGWVMSTDFLNQSRGIALFFRYTPDLFYFDERRFSGNMISNPTYAGLRWD